MDDISQLTADLLIVLTAGLIAGAVCKRIGVSMLVGYLIVGGLIGEGVLGFVNQENHELERIAHLGALLLLFSVGIEFSLGELIRLSRFFLLGGIIQMTLVAIPVTFVCIALGMELNASLLAGSAVALSSTVLTFKALAEWGQTASPHGRRAIGILLFQDVALVPLMLLVPLLTHSGEPPTLAAYGILGGKSLVFVIGVCCVHSIFRRWLVPGLARLRSVELVILFAVCLLGGVSWTAYQMGLPSAVGALAAGIILSGTRISKQIDTIVLPFREIFAAIFFVTLGTLLNPGQFIDEPLLLSFGLVFIILIKGTAAAIALRSVGLHPKAAIGMGLGLAQMGEFSFLLLSAGVKQGLFSHANYNRMLFIALGTLILTPQLIRYGLRWTSDERAGAEKSEHDEADGHGLHHDLGRHALVIGIGMIGRQISSQLEMKGVDVRLLDFSSINLHPFAQQGFQTVAGDARDPEVLQRADASNCNLSVVCVPDDQNANEIVSALRSLNSNSTIVVRCRYQGNVAAMRRAGANSVVSEEGTASEALLKWCERFVQNSH
ncbi:Inner membrane protein YbaL [Novipirellula galeiformis]|uniref:Inner membrane protein YbaL n=1 Tax=Novipirellula galeiformis TaxID=2528004 RepID=A0A5C6CB22_9BACT|nr:cation:proton antiporter [Novipirellula galeiformis]TWU20621.1 Inner membrane protein YbaL [Novipirellula galeiformis]